MILKQRSSLRTDAAKTRGLPTVFVVDDDPAIRSMLRELIESVNLRIETHPDAASFLSAYDPWQSGCLVLDVRMPGMSGIDLQEVLTAKGPAIPVILMTGFGDISMAVDAMRLGAFDFIEKPFKPQKLLDRIQQALTSDAVRLRDRAHREALARRFDLLTPREIEVVKLVITGMTNKQVATQLGISPQAIDAHRSRAMDKLNANSVAELVQLVVRAADHPRSPFGQKKRLASSCPA